YSSAASVWYKRGVLQKISWPSRGIGEICFAATRAVQSFRRRILQIYEGALSSCSQEGRNEKKKPPRWAVFFKFKIIKKGTGYVLYYRHTMAAIQNPWSGHSPDTPEPTAGHWANAAE
ncbi:hypothetical protein, partial [Salmonella enterica]|uniref:hypothetical protein n=1 Tax=Salmonella enterica TaxID=28901 RepID=UPI001F218188